jgi:parallel beta-helix repeat protein
LPPLTDATGVVINGLSQEGSTLGAKPPATLQLQIVLDGSQAGETPGIWILSPNNQVTGLAIQNFREDGIRIQGIKRGTSNNTIRHCVVGLDLDGVTPRPNGVGARLNGWAGIDHWAGISLVSIPHSAGLVHDNLILGNVVSANAGDGILLADCMGGRVFSNTLSGNFIGSTRAGDAPAGNTRDGILLYGGSYGNTMLANTIVGNGSDGVHIVGDQSRNAQAHHNTIKKNVIGVNTTHHQMGNARSGINVGGREYAYAGGFASNNTIQGNAIAANGHNGITIWEYPDKMANADGNLISQNAIYANAAAAVDLGDDGVNGNRAGTEGTPNASLTAPVILEAEYGRGVATVHGVVDQRGASRLLTVELFKCNIAPTQRCKGPVFLGTATPDADGVWHFSTNGLLEANDSIVAVLIDEQGNTSEYAMHHPVGLMEFDELPRMTDHYVGKSAGMASAQFVTLEPHPTESLTDIRFEVTNDCWGILEVYTDRGELVTTLLDRWLPKGQYSVQWDRLNWCGNAVPPGVYVCRLEADGLRQTSTIAVR